ncbi:MAG: hypothetical protein IJ429_06430 [Lachnospiraceae bacterium]|nr:hypothetical protein [Lachnospiraceae bacterium]
MSFDVFPTKNKIPKCDEIIRYSVRLLRDYLKREKIDKDIEISAIEVSDTKEIHINPTNLTLNEKCHTTFNLNDEGEAYVFFHKLTDVDNDFWKEELQENINAQSMKEKINANLEIGYSWSIKRIMGQPAIVSLYYGYLAIAIAVLTDGIIYSDDGAWDYSCFPIEGSNFEEKYLKVEKIKEEMVKDNIEKWLSELKK